MTNEITRVGASTLTFTAEQRRILLDSFANGASDSEFAALLEVAQRRSLDPFKREIFFVQRWDAQKGRNVWATQVSIDGLRLVAERSGLYAGQGEPEFVENADGSLKACRVAVFRKDWPRPAMGVAYWEEYVQTTRDKQTGKTRPNAMWSKMPRTMLAKCAEALAIRKAFPESAAGLYTSEEMGQADNDAPRPAHVVDVQVQRPQLAAPAEEAEAADAPQGSRAWAAYVEAIGRQTHLVDIHARYVGLIADLREEGNDPEAYTSDRDGPGAATLACRRVAELGHHLSSAERQVLLGVHGGELARWIDAAAAAIDANALGTPIATAAAWWITHRGEIDRALSEPVYMVIARRLASDGTDVAQIKAAKAALTAEVKRQTQPPSTPPTGTDGPSAPRHEAANGNAETVTAEALASRERVASKGGVSAYLASKGSRREIESAVRAHGRHVEGFIDAAAARLEALTPADQHGARVSIETLRAQVSAWAAEGPVAAAKKAA